MKTKKPSPSIDLQTQVTELQEKLARSLADYSNLEKRVDRDRQLFATLASVSVISKMIDVLDDLYLSYQHLQDQGLKMTIDKFIAVLKTEGLEEINSQDREFDPTKMEAIDVVEGKENTVYSVKKRGYTLNGQVIRPAQVIVGKTKN